MRRAALGLAVSTLAAATLLLALPVSPASAATVNIDVSDFWYCDSSYNNGVCETQIDIGDTVHWDWVSGIHTVTECGADCDNPTGSPLFDSGIQAASSTYEYTFNTPGTYLYFCEVHPLSMRGRIVAGTVGGAAELPGVKLSPVGAPASAGSGAGDTIAVIAGAIGGAFVIVGAAWYVRRRLAA